MRRGRELKMVKLKTNHQKIGRDNKMFTLTKRCFFNVSLRMLIAFLFVQTSFAQQAEVELSPSEALVNESFYLTFKVKMNGAGDPYISFTPVNAEVLNRREQGVSISTIVINGKFTTTREQSYVYELISDRSGTAYIKNISVELSGKTEKLKDLRINILNEKRKLQDVFLEAVPSKNKIYIGEGIDVNYYLYYKIPVVANDIKEFPKLNKFIKRFYKTSGNVETVQYKGEVYRRVLAYSARAYPEKVGVAVLDSMRISAQVADNRSFDPFGGLSNSYRQKEISSPRVDIEVMPIPTDGMPQNFSGLVGNHEFDLLGGKSKYLINEPIEFKLEVKGPGALENFQPPSLFTSDLVEEFDTKSDLVEISEGVANKKFEFTYLARSEIALPARQITFSVFDPDKKIFVEKKITVPAISVAGGGSSLKKEDNKNSNKTKMEQKNIGPSFSLDMLPDWLRPVGVKNKKTVGLVGVENESSKTNMDLFLITGSIVFVFLSALLIFTDFRKNKINESVQKKFDVYLKKFKHRPSYENLYLLLGHVFCDNSDVVKSLKHCSLNNECKNYILSLIGSLEQAQFSKVQGSAEVRNIDYRHLKSLRRLLKDKDEDNR